MDTYYKNLTEINQQKRGLFSNESLIATIFMVAILNGYIAEIAKLWALSAPTNLVYIFIYLLALVAWGKALVNRTGFTLGLLVFSFLYISISVQIIPEISDYFFNFGGGSAGEIAQSDFAFFFGLCMPTFILCKCDIDLEVLKKYLYRYSAVALIMFIIMMFLQVFVYAQKINYMTVAYNALPCIFFVYYDSRKSGKKSSYFLWIASIAGLFIGGCRGALLTAVVLMIIWEIRALKDLTAGKILGLLFVLAVCTLVIFNLEKLVEALSDFLGGFGYSSRLLDKFLGESSDGDLFHFSDRQKLYDRIIEELNIFGHGIYADRRILNDSYVHNFILEILCHFGILPGFIILLGFVSFLYRSYKRAKFAENEFLIFAVLAFVCIVFVKMSFSATYLVDRSFWLFFGLSSLTFNHEVKNETISKIDYMSFYES